MTDPVISFELSYKSGTIRVQRHSIAGQVIYRVQFSDRRQPLVLTRALTADASRFWTSVPEGRQREAEEIGTLITDYLHQNPG